VVFTGPYKVRETPLLAFLGLKSSEKDSHRWFITMLGHGDDETNMV